MNGTNETTPPPLDDRVQSGIYNSLYEHLPIIIPIIFYIGAGYLLDYIFVAGTLEFRWLYSLLLVLSAIVTLVFATIQFIRGEFSTYINLRIIAGFLIILCLMSPFASIFSSIKQSIPTINYFRWDYDLMRIDHILHFGKHPWEIFRNLLDNDHIIRFLDNVYMSWFFTLFFFCLWMAWSRHRVLRLKFFICTIIIWMIFGSLLGTIFSSAGPCYYAKVVINGHDPYQPLMNALLRIHETGSLWAIRNQFGIWMAYTNREWLPFGGISAMPSIHVAMAMLFALVGKEVHRWLGVVMALYAAAIFLGSIVLGWHYAIDGYISIFLVIVVWRTSGFIINKYINPDINYLSMAGPTLNKVEK